MFCLVYSPGPYGRNQKHVGVFAAKHQNLHTGTVFDAERREMSHLAKKCHGLLKKMRFSGKNLGKIALTPNRSSKSHKNFRERNYRFALAAYQILAKSVH